MQSRRTDFKAQVARGALAMQTPDSLSKLKVGFSERRRLAAERLPEEFEALRDSGTRIKDHTRTI